MFIKINTKDDIEYLEDAVSYVYEDINVALDDFACKKTTDGLLAVFDELHRAVSSIHYVVFNCTDITNELMNTPYEENILNQFYEKYTKDLIDYVNSRLQAI